MPKNVELLDNTNDKLYPKTKAEQVIVTSTKNLDVKLTEVDTKIKDVTDEVVAARNKTGNTHPTLKARLDAMEDGSTNIQNIVNQVQATANQANNTANAVKQEVEQARNGEANLKTRLDNMDAKMNDYLPLTGGTLTGTLTMGAGDIALANASSISIKNTAGTNRTALSFPNADGLRVGGTSEDTIIASRSVPKWFNGTNKVDLLTVRGGEVNGNITFTNYGTGNQGAIIASKELFNNTGNGQVIDVRDDKVIVGNEVATLNLRSDLDPTCTVGTNEYTMWHSGNAPIDVNATPNTLVKRRGDGWIDNGNSGIVANTIRSAGINVLIGGNDTDGTYTGDVVFMTNMRPTNERNIRIGSYNYKFSECWVTAGAFNTSDERCKTNIETFDIQDCFNMVKNTEVKSYTLLFGNKTKMSDNELQTATVEQESKSAYQQLGIIAQDIVDYKCSDYILVQDNPEDLYAINPYNLTSAVMGALKVEIQKREELEERVKQLAEEVKALKNA